MAAPSRHGPVPVTGNTQNPEIVLTAVNAGYIHASLGLRSLYANLGDLRGRSCIAEGTRRLGIPELARFIAGLNPSIVGVSVSIWNHRESRELLERLAQDLPQAWLVVGGPEASYLPDDHPLFTRAHVLVRGEGEEVFPRLCRELLGIPGPHGSPDPGLVSGSESVPRRTGHLRVIQARQPDPAHLELPYGFLEDRDLSNRLMYIETSRGCPFSCEFCLSSVQGRVREFPLKPVLDQVTRLYERGGRYFKVIDRTFNLDLDRARRTLTFFRELFLGNPREGAYVQFEVVPDRLPQELREPIAAFPPGTLRLEVGIQTLNNAVAARINRKQDQPRTLDNLAFLSEQTGAVIHADLIIGLPGEDLESFARGFDRLWQLQPGEIQLGVLKALPGTTLHRHDGPWGMVFNPDPPYEIMQTGAMNRDTMDKMKVAAKFWELVVNRGRYPEEVGRLNPPKEGAFYRFLALSEYLYNRLGRTWGIDASELRALLATYPG
ncbi:B12-binding domain-containing radical SAM protein [Spirochaeta lutea]|uniref:B12-binding domain-containing radical SAM protein n=1 Tax=Spirochaeta lutea TaxID=1480694 RepID=UPI000689800C|nr:radical SAM protein [Spirochaeta lutea]